MATRSRGRITYLAVDEPSGVTLWLGDLDIGDEQVGALGTVDGTGATFDVDYPINELLPALADPERVELSLSASAGMTTPGIGMIRVLR